MDINNLLKKRVFTRSAPDLILPNLPTVNNVNATEEVKMPKLNRLKISQEQMLRELDPNSHDINNVAIYPDKIKNEGKENQETVFIARVSLPIQSFIANRQAIHLFGNPITLSKTRNTNEETFNDFVEYWRFNNIDEALLDVCKSVKSTGDGAVAFYVDKDKELSYQTWSFKKGDILYPHYEADGVTLKHFVRRFSSVNEDGESTEKLEVYDNKSRYIYTNIEGDWKQEGVKESHGFDRVPIAYYREEDVAWGEVQELINKLERSLSDFRDSNAYFTFGMLFIKGGDIEVLPNKTTQGKVITSEDSDADAKMLEQGDVAPGFKYEFETYWQQIKDLTGTVIIKPEDFKGGDVSGATVKSYYDPAIQQAMLSKPVVSGFIKQVVAIVKDAFGISESKALKTSNLRVKGEVDIYVPRNAMEEVTMMTTAAAAGGISKQTLSERLKFTATDEYERIKTQTDEERASTENVGTGKVAESE